MDPAEILKRLQEAQVARQSSTKVNTAPKRDDRVPLTWQDPSTSEMSYHNRGKTVPDIELGDPLGPLEVIINAMGAKRGIQYVLKNKVKPKVATGYMKFLEKKGYEVTEERAGNFLITGQTKTPMVDWDWADPMHTMPGQVTIKNPQDAIKQIKKYAELSPSTWKLYKTKGGMRGFNLTERMEANKFYDTILDEDLVSRTNAHLKKLRAVRKTDSNIEDWTKVQHKIAQLNLTLKETQRGALHGLKSDPMYEQLAKEGNTYHARVSPKKGRVGETAAAEYFATIGDPKLVNRQSLLDIILSHDIPNYLYKK